MADFRDRRQFERLLLPDDAVALDESGRRLGRVSQAGGGGMLILLEVPAAEFQVGQRLRVTVLEPATSIMHTLDIRVRYLHSDSLGVEFVAGESEAGR
jgi:hypothetical protein